jgi:hypothetical protein
MNTLHKYRHPKRSAKPVVLALALALAGSAALAASTNDVVTTRADESINQQYGRGSVYSFSPDAKPIYPEQAGSNVFGTMKTYAAEAWHKTEGFAVAAWDKTTDFFTQPPSAQTEPRAMDAQALRRHRPSPFFESHNASGPTPH